MPLAYDSAAAYLIETQLTFFHQAINRRRVNPEPLGYFLD